MDKHDSECYRFGPFVLEVKERTLRRGGVTIPLQAKAFDLLLTLVRGAGRTVTKSELMAALWPDAVVEENNLTQTAFVLRKALGEGGDEAYIRTIPRQGYRFVLPVSVNGAGTKLHSARYWIRAAGIVLVILAVAAGLAYFRPKQPAPINLSAYRYRPFAYTQGQESHGRWSPDGKNIAFLQGQYAPNLQGQHARRLMVQPSDGGAATQLLEMPVNNCCTDIAWSPDGESIYFAKSDGIYSMSRAGGQPELILKLADPSFVFDLSFDGRALAIWRTHKTSEGTLHGSVWISSPPGTEPREYKPAPFAGIGNLGPQFLRFSPDGRLLYLSIYTFSGNTVETWLLPFPDGKDSPRHIFGNVQWHDPVHASWMPDSRRLVLSGSVGSLRDPALWLADIGNEYLTQLTDGSGRQEDPAISPDGRRVLFTRVQEDSDLVELPLDGSRPRKLLATGASEYSPAWSPKGGEFAYLTQRNGSDELFVRSSQGEWERPLATTHEFPALMWLSRPAISPDGAHIAYGVVLRDPNRPLGSVYVSPTAGGAPTWIATGSAPSWSPDGASLAFMWLKPNGASALATLRIGSNQQPFEIADLTCVPTSPAWSPSGEWIACPTPNETVLVSPDGKVKRKLRPLNIPLTWSKDSQTLYGLRGESGESSLLAEDVRSGAIRRVADYGTEITPYSGGHGPARQLSLSHDGKSLAIGSLKRETNLWILEGALK